LLYHHDLVIRALFLEVVCTAERWGWH